MKKFISAALSLLLIVLVLAPAAPVSSASSGTTQMANVIFLVRFNGDSEDVFNAPAEGYTKSAWERLNGFYNDTSSLYQGIDCSFKKYISLVSRNKLNITNIFPQVTDGVAATLTLQYGLEHYESNDEAVIDEVIAYANTLTNFPANGQKIDNISADVLDNLTIIIQGSSAEDTNSLMWPHKSVSGGSARIKNKYYVRNYNILTSEMVFNGSKQGVITHEFMHSVGFPDLYRYAGNGSPVGYWDIMAGTSPYLQYPLSYMRSLFGWVDLAQAESSGHYSLDVVSSETGTVALKIATPMSDTEFFVLEYRIREQSSYAGIGIETKIPGSGLLIYRVNNSLEHLTNSTGEDYIYIFRPGDTSTTDSAGDLLDAAINPADGETAYGSADFTKAVTDDTIFYSSGANSGIVISNVAYSTDNSKIEFDLSLPDYSSLDLWDKLGGTVTSGVSGETDMFTCDNGDVYVAFTKYTEISSVAEAWKWNGTAWSKLGSSVNDVFTPQIFVMNGTPYFSCLGNDGGASVRKWNGSSWVLVGNDTAYSYPSSPSFVTDGTSLYFCYVYNDYGGDTNRLVIRRVTDTGLVAYNSSLTSSNNFSSVAVGYFDGSFYAAYSYFGWNLTDDTSHISWLDENGTWQDEHSLDKTGANSHFIVSGNGKLFVLAGKFNEAPSLASFNGAIWAEETLADIGTTYSSLAISVYNGEPYVAYTVSGLTKVLAKTNDAWAQFGGTVTEDVGSCDISVRGTTVIVATSANTTGAAIVSIKTVKTTPLPQIKPAHGTGTVIDSVDKFIYGLSENVRSLDIYVTVTNGGTLTYSDVLGTGAEVLLKNSIGETVDTYVILIFGDVNGDALINGNDAFFVNMLVSGLILPENLTPAKLAAADADRDGAIDSDDALLIESTALKKNAVSQTDPLASPAEAAEIEVVTTNEVLPAICPIFSFFMKLQAFFSELPTFLHIFHFLGHV